MNYKRIFVLILDSLGVGEASDASNYNDLGSNTLKHVLEHRDLFIPNLEKLGFLSTINLEENENTEAYYTIARPSTYGKDSLSGHYEIVGINNEIAFSNFTDTGFPRELLEAVVTITNRRLLGNKAAPGIEIINELGQRHIDTGALIIFTSSDSTLQIAAHEDVLPPQRLYQYCERIRKITDNDLYRIGRVIARPFKGKNGNFRFTTDRKDYAVKPPKGNLLEKLEEKELQVIGIGKIGDVFDKEGITKNITARDNIDAINKLTDIMDKKFEGLCLVNLRDFDDYGHNRNPDKYADKVEELDVEIPIILNKLDNEDLLIITADHGNDPTYPGNDHTRENLPVIIYNRDLIEPKKLDPLNSLADIGATIADNFLVDRPTIGKSFLEELE